jgi:glutamate carboxypeptidase
VSDDLAADLRSLAAELADDALELLAELTALDAPSGDGEALRAPADLLAGRLTELNGDVVRHAASAGDHLEARFGAAGGGAVLVLAHYDTVWPRGTAAARPLRADGPVVYGPGVFDMRGGIAAALTALHLLRRLGLPERDVTVLVTADEETGSRTSVDLIRALGREATAVLVPEPPLPGGVLKTARKGVAGYRLAVRGRAAHAGIDPERGVSAVHELAELVARLERSARRDAGTTINVGRIGGGVRLNVVADKAWAEVEYRFASEAEHTRVEAELSALTPMREGVSITVEPLGARPPLERTAPIAAAFERARELARPLGVELREGTTGGASDANFLGPLGVAVLDGLGPDGGGAHALDEHVRVDSIEERIALLALLIARL